MVTEGSQSFGDLKSRLDEIVSLVSVSELPLDQALDLYEEAVGIGLQASRIMEEGITAQESDAVSDNDEVVPDSDPCVKA